MDTIQWDQMEGGAVVILRNVRGITNSQLILSDEKLRHFAKSINFNLEYVLLSLVQGGGRVSCE